MVATDTHLQILDLPT